MHFVIGFLKPKKQIGGTEFAGVVTAIGTNVKSFKVGDKVFGFDDQVLSAYAEFLTIKEDKAIAKIPDNISFQQAAASLEGAHYAYTTLCKVNIKSGDKIFVNGGSGGIGSAMIQLLQQYDVDITATTETKNLDLVRQLGCSKVIDFTTTDFTQEKEVQYDFIFDTVGKSSFSKCKPLLKPNGIYNSSELGKNGVNLWHTLSTQFSKGQKVIFPIPHNIRISLDHIKVLLENGDFDPVVDRVFSFEEIPQAFVYVERGMKVGNVVVEIR